MNQKPNKKSTIIATVNHFADTNEYLAEHCQMLRACGVDYILVLTQVTSNTGIKDNSGLALCIELRRSGIINDYSLFIPNSNYTVTGKNEKAKRKLGLDKAKELGLGKYDYFINTDTDEFYTPKEFQLAVKYLAKNKEGVKGLCFPLYTYYKTRNLRTEKPDNYFVSGLYKLSKDLILGDTLKIRVDPTRCYNYEAYSPIYVKIFDKCIMHHYSWVRADIEKKIASSSAKGNIIRNKFYEQYLSLEVGSFVNGNKLIEV